MRPSPVGNATFLVEQAVQQGPVYLDILPVRRIAIAVIAEYIQVLISVIKGKTCVVFGRQAHIPARIYRSVCAEGFIPDQPDIYDAGISSSIIPGRRIGDQFNGFNL